jgi:hypothetical protein
MSLLSMLLVLSLQWSAAKGSKQKALVRGAQDASNTGPSWQPDRCANFITHAKRNCLLNHASHKLMPAACIGRCEVQAFGL